MEYISPGNIWKVFFKYKIIIVVLIFIIIKYMLLVTGSKFIIILNIYLYDSSRNESKQKFKKFHACTNQELLRFTFPDVLILLLRVKMTNIKAAR
jgi:hypothetical protein